MLFAGMLQPIPGADYVVRLKASDTGFGKVEKLGSFWGVYIRKWA